MPYQLRRHESLLLPIVRDTQEQTLKYFGSNGAEVLEKVSEATECYEILITLPTGYRFPHQSYYPYNLPFYEALEELNTSVILAFSGEYKNAIQHLRFLFELAYLGIYMFKPMSEGWVKKWLLGKEKTPTFTDIRNDIGSRDRFKILSKSSGIAITEKCRRHYDELSQYVHTRGFHTLGTNIRGTTVPIFNPDAFQIWANLLHGTIKIIAIGIIAQFPQTLQRLPLYDKFGFFESPRGGFLEPFEVEKLEKLFEPELLLKLQAFSNKHHAEVLPVKWEGFDKIPNLSLNRLKLSFDKYTTLLELAGGGITKIL